ncbi:MAG: sugar phosphate nucleotidyltransferase [Anaerolineales bacterium]|jgi:NDP-sugar pyrophosphorylase family protein|nr:sugar phosphate nucleotidyltransferase [Anaerolineales bacterium]
MEAVILAGGLGSRLKPFTQVIPKPLLPIGESSVLEIQILSLKKCGFNHVYIATNYKSDYFRAFLGDGSKYGVRIDYSEEKKPLGTCGPVMLLKDQLTEPFLLMNGDILTTLDFKAAYAFATRLDTYLTVFTKKIATPFRFGKVISEGNFVSGIEEKPTIDIEILAGIYILKPAVFDLIPADQYYGIDMLIKLLLSRNMKIAKYLITDYWLDIGQPNDYQSAQASYNEYFIDLVNEAKNKNDE